MRPASFQQVNGSGVRVKVAVAVADAANVDWVSVAVVAADGMVWFVAVGDVDIAWVGGSTGT